MDRTLNLITECGRLAAELEAQREIVAVLTGKRVPFIAGLTQHTVQLGPVEVTVSVEWDGDDAQVVYAWLHGQKTNPEDWVHPHVLEGWERQLSQDKRERGGLRVCVGEAP